MTTAAAYLVVRREDGFGEVYPLQPGQTYSLGRAATNTIVLKDDLASRDHCEVLHSGGRWHLRDLGSLNGTKVNDIRVEGERPLSPRDEIHLGRTHLLFVESMDQLPNPPPDPAAGGDDGLSIKKRLGQARFLTPQDPLTGDRPAPTGRSLSRDLSLLYRLALDMGNAGTYDDLCRLVLDALFDATNAEVGAILTVPTLEVTIHRHRDPSVTNYIRVSEYVSDEVLARRDAILAEDVARDKILRSRVSLSLLGATSLICAPILYANDVLGLIHLYRTDPHRALDADDLEFTVAVAKQLGVAIHHVRQKQRVSTLAAENSILKAQLRAERDHAFSPHAVATLYPAPIALAYCRLCRRQEPTARLHAIIGAVEAVLRYLVALGLSDLIRCLSEQEDTGTLAHQAFDCLRKPKPMQMGHWVELLRETARTLLSFNGRFIEELPVVCKPGGVVDGRILASLVQERNQFIHPPSNIPLTAEQALEAVGRVRPQLEELLREVRFVCRYPLGFLSSGYSHKSTLPSGPYRYRVHSCMGMRAGETG